MEKISFHGVVPQVFAHVPQLHSDIWAKDVCFEKGKVYLLEADSGKGKSTFCSYIIGYRHDFAGELCFDNNAVTKLSMRQWTEVRKHHISYLFQELRLFPELSAIDNVLIKNSLTHHVAEQTIVEWFDRLGLSDKVHTPIGLMSFGQQQRVAMMRTLAQPFDFLLADEPISHLDDENAATMAQLMLEQAYQQEAGIIITSIGKHMDIPYDKVYRL